MSRTMANSLFITTFLFQYHEMPLFTNNPRQNKASIGAWRIVGQIVVTSQEQFHSLRPPRPLEPSPSSKVKLLA